MGTPGWREGNTGPQAPSTRVATARRRPHVPAGPRLGTSASRGRRAARGPNADWRRPSAGAPAAARRPAGRYRPYTSTARPRTSSTVTAVRTAAPGRPVAATSSSGLPAPPASARATAASAGRSPRRCAAVADAADAGDPASRPRSSRSSRTPATTLASGPASRRNASDPATAGSSRRPGTRNRPRPCSSAHAAVVSAPLRAPASTTTVASARPLMMRFRRGKVPRLGAVSGANSLTTAPPPATIARARPRFAAG